MPAAEGPSTRSTRVKPSARAVSQIMAALKKSENADGPTMTQIVKFVSSALAKPATKRQICTALKRGVEFGILKRKRGHYLITSPEESFNHLPLSGKVGARSRYPAKVDKAKRRAPLRAKRSSVTSR
ncbi:uncharacterized protein LOC131668817 [Phymastichus coffea]|uniref:uncharacterized protein LOC131668817 n=1 Tax=Phymastichus coffea TaxID=108790 RepID=UPI00273A837D|nr:uncharacterized protein LOC131668817 [Phymastichus coffea]